MARPTVNQEDKRLIQVNIRLTRAEHDKAVSYAEASALTPANWIRQKVFTGRFPPFKVSPLNAAIYRELHRIGVNLNQLIKQMHAGKAPSLTGIIGELIKQQKEILNALLHDSRPGKGQGVPGRTEV